MIKLQSSNVLFLHLFIYLFCSSVNTLTYVALFRPSVLLMFQSHFGKGHVLLVN